MDFFSINFACCFLKLFVLLSSTICCENDFHNFILLWMMRSFLWAFLNLLPYHFTWCPWFCLMGNRDWACTDQWFGKFSHSEHKPVVFHIQVNRTLGSQTNFPGILMIKNKHHHPQTLTHTSHFPEKREISMCYSCFHRLYAREHNACYRS